MGKIIEKKIQDAILFGAFSFIGGIVAKNIYDRMRGGNSGGSI